MTLKAIEVRTSNGKTALEYAYEKGFMDVAKMLVSYMSPESVNSSNLDLSSILELKGIQISKLPKEHCPAKKNAKGKNIDKGEKLQRSEEKLSEARNNLDEELRNLENCINTKPANDVITQSTTPTMTAKEAGAVIEGLIAELEYYANMDQLESVESSLVKIVTIGTHIPTDI